MRGAGRAPREPHRHFFFFAAGAVYLDGSCVPHMCPDLSRAAWAAVQPAEEAADGVWRALVGTVPASLPQTAQAAEHLALLEAARELPPDSPGQARPYEAQGRAGEQGGGARRTVLLSIRA